MKVNTHLHSATMQAVRYIDLGVKDYKETWDYQQSIHHRLTEMKTGRTKNDAQPHLIFVEHPHVYTLGKSGKANNLLINTGFLHSLGATFYRTDRGGDITYHGPGQIVGYPIIDLDAFNMGVKQYITTLEQVIIATLLEYHIAATHMEGATGVWIDAENAALSRKICALGVRVSRGITMHGFALNVNTDLSYFKHINPCGFSSKAVTSIERELDCKPEISEIKKRLLHHFQHYFHVTLILD